MATCVVLNRLSPEGLRTFENDPDPINQEIKETVEGVGARMVVAQRPLWGLASSLPGLGNYDYALVLEAPDYETVKRASVELRNCRAARFETLVAVSVRD